MSFLSSWRWTGHKKARQLENSTFPDCDMQSLYLLKVGQKNQWNNVSKALLQYVKKKSIVFFLWKIAKERK